MCIVRDTGKESLAKHNPTQCLLKGVFNMSSSGGMARRVDECTALVHQRADDAPESIAIIIYIIDITTLKGALNMTSAGGKARRTGGRVAPLAPQHSERQAHGNTYKDRRWVR